MIALLILLDIMIYKFTSFNSFFFLLSLNFISKKDYFSVILIGLFLDFILLDKPFVNTIILLLLFILNKKYFSLKKRHLKSYLLITIFNYAFFTLSLSILNQNFSINSFLLSLLINIIFAITSYNLFKKHIKLAR